MSSCLSDIMRSWWRGRLKKGIFFSRTLPWPGDEGRKDPMDRTHVITKEEIRQDFCRAREARKQKEGRYGVR